MTPERLAHTRRKRVLQVLALVWLLVTGTAVAIWASEPVDTSIAGFWPIWIAIITGLPVGLVGLYVFARRPIKEASLQGGWATGRGVATVLFTDIVGSTERAQELGDGRWRGVLDRHDAAARAVVLRHGGRPIKTTGDGILATFDGPGEAIRAARALREEVRSLGIDIRAGVHTGEVERRGVDVGGIGVHIAARVMGTAEPGQILVSRTVRDLVVGSDVTLVPRGTAGLKGLEGEWELFLVAGG
jgi:class 3 adenylate cyclase